MTEQPASYFKVGGTPAGPPPPGAGPVAGGKSRRGIGAVTDNFRRNRTTWLIGAGVVVAGVAVYQARTEGVDDDDGTEPDDLESAERYELDTRDTDVYNELQPELEEIADRIDEHEQETRPPGTGKGPRPLPPGKPVKHFHRGANTDRDREKEGLWHTHPGGDKAHKHWWLTGPKGPKPKPPKGKPKPGQRDDRRDDRDLREYKDAVQRGKDGPRTNRRYTVQRGDTLGEIAKQHKIGAKRLYQRNRQPIEQAAKKHGRGNSHRGNLIFPGTTLAIPGKAKRRR